MSDGLSGEMKKPLRKGHLQYTNRGLEFYFSRKFDVYQNLAQRTTLEADLIHL